MTDVIEVLLNLQIPTMLIVAGLLIIILGFVTKIGGLIEVSREQKKFTIPIGLFLLVLGIVLNFASSPPPPSPPITTTTPTRIPPTTGEKPSNNEPTVTYNMNKIDSSSSYPAFLTKNTIIKHRSLVGE
ncbi:MAG: hypothetical protein F6K08_30470 [Okeania sp. SIO1H6]|nr:hypothetical protein [Okeania sp. SIO1H6]